MPFCVAAYLSHYNYSINEYTSTADLQHKKQDICSVEHGICPTAEFTSLNKSELCSNFGDSAITKGQIALFSLRMRETAIFLLPVKNLTSSSCSPTPISYMAREFWRYVNI